MNYQKSVKIMPNTAYSDLLLFGMLWEEGIFDKAFLHLDGSKKISHNVEVSDLLEQN